MEPTNAAGLSRVLNGKFGEGAYTAFKAENGPRQFAAVFVRAHNKTQLQKAFAYLRSLGYVLEYTDNGSLLRVVGRRSDSGKIFGM